MRTRVRFLSLVLIAGIAGLGGCYKHVVGTKGVGAADDVDVYEPNAPAGPDPIEEIEAGVWGDEPADETWRERGRKVDR